MAQRDNRLSRLAQAHVVGEDRPPPAEQERDAFDLVREESVGERDRASEGRVRIAGQLEQPGECRSLGVERVGHTVIAVGYQLSAVRKILLILSEISS